MNLLLKNTHGKHSHARPLGVAHRARLPRAVVDPSSLKLSGLVLTVEHDDRDHQTRDILGHEIEEVVERICCRGLDGARPVEGHGNHAVERPDHKAEADGQLTTNLGVVGPEDNKEGRKRA